MHFTNLNSFTFVKLLFTRCRLFVLELLMLPLLLFIIIIIK